MARIPTYEMFIDWTNHGGLTAGLQNWYVDTQAGEAELEASTDFVYIGSESLKVTRNTDFKVWRPIRLPRNVETEITVWVYNPTASTATGVEFWLWTDEDFASSTLWDSVSTTTNDTWVPLTITYNDDFRDNWIIEVRVNGSAGSEAYIGWTELRTTLDDVTCDLISTGKVPDIVYGRDAAQELAAIRAGEMSFGLMNPDGLYSPRNSASPLYGYLAPNRQVLIQATLDGQRYIMFNGYIEDYDLHADLNSQRVEFQCRDLTTRLEDIDVSTRLHTSIRTGAALIDILEEAGVYQRIEIGPYIDPENALRIEPYIDTGATTLRWWAFHGKASDGIEEVLNAEGPPSLYSVGISNQIIYRDRLHRKRLSYAPLPAYTVVGCEDEVTDATTEFPVDVSSGIEESWSTLTNRAQVQATIADVANEVSVIWTDPVARHTFSGKKVFTADVEGFIDGVSPVQGRVVIAENFGPDETDVSVGYEPDDADYIVEDGRVTLESFAATGSQVSITLSAAGTATISGLRFRARAVTFTSYSEHIDDVGSQTYYGEVRPYDYDGGRAGPNDVEDVARWVLKQNSSVRARASLVFKNISDDAMRSILETDLSQLVGVDVDRWYVDTAFTVEGITHRVEQMGADHTITLSAEEQYPSGYENPELTFDVEGRGFDQGTFGTGNPPTALSALFVEGGEYAYTTDKPSFHSNVLDVRARVYPTEWFVSGFQPVVGQWLESTNQRAWAAGINGVALETHHSPNGTTENSWGSPSAVARVNYLRWVYINNNGTGNREYRWYTGASMDGPWFSLGTNTSFAPEDIHDSTAIMSVGGLPGSSDAFDGRILEVQVRSAIDGPLIASPNFSIQPPGTTSFDDDQGNTWLLSSGALIETGVPPFILGTSQLDGLHGVWY